MSKREFTVPNEYPYDRSTPGRWILSHVGRYPVFPVIALLSTILNNWFYSSIPVLIGRGFEVVSQSPVTLPRMFMIATTAMLYALGQGLTGLSRNYAVESLAQRIEMDSRDELYVSLLGKSQTFHGRQRVGDIMARATNDVHALNLMFSPGLNLIIDSAWAIIIPLFLIARIRLELLLVPVVFLVVLAITVADYARRLQPVSAALQEQFGLLDAEVTEVISGIEVVKANVQERQEWSRFVRNAQKYREYFVEQGYIQARYLPLLAFAVAHAAGVFHALWLWRSGAIGVGDAVAFIGLIASFRFATFISLFSFSQVQVGLAAATRILETILTETNLDENVNGFSGRMRGEVRFDHVSFAYNVKPVVVDVSFHVRPGQTVAIVGETGSGKTTLTRLINRIFDADTGRVLVDDVNVCDWNLQALRSQISTIEQDIFLFSGSVRENIAFGRMDATQEEIERAAREAQADEFIERMPGGYDAVIGERGVTLSGGQRQRIAIARALITNPAILILDDSTSAIDSATEDRIQRAIRRVSRDRTTFLITHRLSQIRWSDWILVLRHGRLIDQGKHEELLRRCDVYRRIFARYD